jgi:hypothetical protein
MVKPMSSVGMFDWKGMLTKDTGEHPFSLDIFAPVLKTPKKAQN